MKSDRPKNLDLQTIKLPVMGLASILHRVSAVVIWVALAFFLPVLSISLGSPEGFESMKSMVTSNFFVQFLTWGFLTALGYYTAGGIKHIVQEFGHFETLEGGQLISQVAIGAGVFLSLLFAIWVWG